MIDHGLVSRNYWRKPCVRRNVRLEGVGRGDTDYPLGIWASIEIKERNTATSKRRRDAEIAALSDDF